MKWFVNRGPLLGAAVFLQYPTALAVAQDPNPSPKEILSKVEEVYTSCRSYQDSGTVVRTNLAPGSRDDEEKSSFTTVFERPGAFRFDYKYIRKDKEEHYIIWAKDDDVRTWWHRDPKLEGQPKSLSFALSVATGVTGGASDAIPMLLLVDANNGRKGRLTNAGLKQITDAKVDDKECMRFQRTYQAVNFEDGSKFDVIQIHSIEKATFLVLRLETEMRDAKFAVRTIITFAPKINENIPAMTLEFNPPTVK